MTSVSNQKTNETQSQKKIGNNEYQIRNQETTENRERGEKNTHTRTLEAGSLTRQTQLMNM